MATSMLKFGTALPVINGSALAYDQNGIGNLTVTLSHSGSSNVLVLQQGVYASVKVNGVLQNAHTFSLPDNATTHFMGLPVGNVHFMAYLLSTQQVYSMSITYKDADGNIVTDSTTNWSSGSGHGEDHMSMPINIYPGYTATGTLEKVS